MILRDYQQRAVENIIAALDRRPVLVAPTGSGKTVMAVEVVRRVNRATLWLAHRKELIDQAAAQLESLGLNVGIIMSGYYPMPLARTQVASVQTLIRRDRPAAELIIVDECHHATADSYRSILDGYPGASVVGLTATPFRLDGRGLGNLFGEIIVAAYADDLCAAGVLHRPRVWAPRIPDLRGLRVVAGDYSLDALSKRMNTTTGNVGIVESWRKLADGLRTVVFAVDREHSIAIADAFRDTGVSAEHIDGTTPRDERDAILARLASGETLIVSNCMVLTEGWDLPALECAIIARPTASLCLHLQMIGRVMRAADGKEGAIVLDCAGNHHVHGLVTRRLVYTLLDSDTVGYSDPLDIRRCRNCGLMFELRAAQCPECGWTPKKDEIRREAPHIHGDGQLSEFDDSSFEYRRQVWNMLEAERIAMGYREGWSYYRFVERFGVKPLTVDGEIIDPSSAGDDEKRKVYMRLLNVARKRGYKTGWAAHRYREIFGTWPEKYVMQ